MNVHCKYCGQGDKRSAMSPLWDVRNPEHPHEWVCKTCGRLIPIGTDVEVAEMLARCLPKEKEEEK